MEQFYLHLVLELERLLSLLKKEQQIKVFNLLFLTKTKLDSYFIYSKTHELKQYGETNGAGSTFIEVSGKQMVKMPILIPSLEEQIKIGFFFKQLDNTIGLQQGKLDKLLELKQVFIRKDVPLVKFLQ